MTRKEQIELAKVIIQFLSMILCAILKLETESQLSFDYNYINDYAKAFLSELEEK